MMVTTSDVLRSEVGESELLIEDFRQKIVSTLNKERERIREVAEREAKAILTKAYQDSATLTERAQEESKQIVNLAREQASKDSDVLLAQVQIKAEQIIKNAEDLARKDAKDRTKKEIDNILKTSKEEAAKIMNQALQTAREQSASILETARNESLQVAKQIRAQAELESRELIMAASDMKQQAASDLADCRKKSEETAELLICQAKQNAVTKAAQEASEIIEQARVRAEKEREFTIAAAVAEAKKAAETESTQIIIKAKQEAEKIFNAAKDRVRVQLEESSFLMAEIQKKMHQVIDNTENIDNNHDSSTKLGISPKIVSDPEPVEPSVSTKHQSILSQQDYSSSKESASPRKEEDVQTKINSLFFNEENRTYQGRLKIDVAPPVDNEQINKLEQYLSSNVDLKVVHKGSSEDESAWIEIDISRPIALLDILHKAPGVKDVVGCKSYIILALKSRQTV
jgi:vacuolar-type H+-ATPase subunit H